MPWPKGKPRKGYVKKDGKPHAVVSRVAVPREDVASDSKPKVSRKVQVERPKVSDVQEDTEKEVDIHGVVGSGAITEVCPACGYAYADGGYCPDCGWSRPFQIFPYGVHSGRRF